MRALNTGELARILDGSGQWMFRAWFKRPQDVAWTDFMDVAGGQWVLSVRTDAETPDQPVGEYTVVLVRKDSGTNIAPGISAEPLNIDASTAYSPIIYPGTQLRFDAANLSASETSGTATWRRWLEGEVEDAEWPGDEVTAVCNSLDGVLMAAQIMREEDRGEPDPGTPIQEEIQGLLDHWMPDGAPTLYTPVDPLKGIGPYIPAKGSLGQQTRDLAQRIGYDLRYKWDDGTSQFRYTLYLPPRSKTAPDVSLGAGEIYEVQSLRTSREWVRNDFEISFLNASTGEREARTRQNASSIARFGRRAMGIVEPDGSPIDSPAKADALLEYADLDLSEPPTEKRIRIPFLPWLELHDVIQVAADDVRFDYTTLWAVVGVSHEVDGEQGASTVVDLRGGSPVGMYFGWHSRKPTLGGEIEDEEEEAPPIVAIKNLRETRLSPEEVRYDWEVTAATAAVWIYEATAEKPIVAEPWPDASTRPTIKLPAATTTYTTDVPTEGSKKFLQFESRDAAVPPAKGNAVRATIDAVPTSKIVIQRIYQSPGNSLSTTDVNVEVADPMGKPFRLHVRVDKASTDDAVQPVITADADGYVDVAGPGTVGPSASFTLTVGGFDALLNEVKVHAARPKRVFFMAVSEDGRSSGWVDWLLKNYLELIDPDGELITDAVKHAWQVAREIRPPVVVPTKPTGNPDEYNIISVTAENGKLYRWDEAGSDWVPVVRAVDMAGQVSTAQIADAAINAQKIGALAVETSKLALSAVTSDILAASAVTETKILDGSISTGKLQAQAVTTAKLAAGAVTANEIAAGAIVTAKLAAGAVTANELAAGSVVAGKIAALSITGNEIAANTIAGTKIQADTISSFHIAANAITADELAANSVVAGKLAAGSIASAALFVSGVIEAAAIAAGAIVAGKLAAGAISASNILVDGVVTAAKLNVGSLSAISANLGTVTAGTIDGVTGNFAGNLTASTIGIGSFWEITHNVTNFRIWAGSSNIMTLGTGGAAFLGTLTATGGFSGSASQWDGLSLGGTCTVTDTGGVVRTVPYI